MNDPLEERRFLILFVDDESQARKYFERAVATTFDVLTASSVAEAKAILAEKGHQIGVLVTDQRMPEAKGVELLRTIKESHPGIVRILTTAFSEIDDAIEAVNTGAIYQYFAKPWDVRELRQMLGRAMRHFLLQRERDLLMREKLSVVHRMLVQDRARSLAVLAAAVSSRLNHTDLAYMAYLQHAGGRQVDGDTLTSSYDPWSALPLETGWLMELTARLVGELHAMDPRIGAAASVIGALQNSGSSSGIAEAPTVTVSGVDITARFSAPLLGRASAILSRQVARGGSVDITVRPREVRETAGVSIRFEGRTPNDAAPPRANQFGALDATERSDLARGIDMLLVYFIAYHHRGDLTYLPGESQFELLLPVDPEASNLPPLDPEALQHAFAQLEGS